MEFPDDLYYSKDHEWLRVDGTTATIGITAFAQSELGDIVYVDVDTMDEDLAVEEVFGSVEAVKTVSDLMMPVSGIVTEFNEALEDSPESINEDPYGAGWIIKVSMSNPDEVNSLMSAAEYMKMAGE